jgi:hypothetical protein
VIWEQISLTAQSDTTRFLRAGAEKAFLIQAEDAALQEAYSALRSLLRPDSHVIVESTRAATVLHSDLFMLVVNGAQTDFKSSAEEQFGEVDVVVWSGEQKPTPDFLPQILQRKPVFPLMVDTLDSQLVSLISDVVDAG